MRYKKEIVLSEPKVEGEEILYVRAYVHTLSHWKAYRVLYPSSSSKAPSNKFSKRANVMYHINKTMQSKAEALSLTEDDIVSLLYKEATFEGSGSNHNARIQAITLLGKSLGMFNDKKEEDDGKVVYNIVNYSNDEDNIKDIEQTSKVVEVIEQTPLPSNIPLIEITNYEDDGNNNKTECKQDQL